MVLRVVLRVVLLKIGQSRLTTLMVPREITVVLISISICRVRKNQSKAPTVIPQPCEPGGKGCPSENGNRGYKASSSRYNLKNRRGHSLLGLRPISSALVDAEDIILLDVFGTRAYLYFRRFPRRCGPEYT